MNSGRPTCAYCAREAGEITEYIEAASEHQFYSPSMYVVAYEATYNAVSNKFCCTECYIKIGMPTDIDGWTAP